MTDSVNLQDPTGMEQLFQQVGNEVAALLMTGWEAVAVFLALAYLVLAMRRNIWCWPAAFISTLIYTVLFWQVALLMESVLNVYYMVMAVYGFWCWRYGARSAGKRCAPGESVTSTNAEDKHALPVTTWSLTQNLLLISGTALVALMIGFLMDNYTEADFPYLDAATTCFAVVTTFMVARKVLENWLYWIVIDAASIYLYLEKGLLLTALLFVVYIVLAVFGYVGWRREMMRQQEADLTVNAYA